MLYRYFSLTILLILVISCNVVNIPGVTDNNQLSESDVISGLKTALQVGTDKAVSTVARPGGYLKDAAIKILLPEEANKAIASLREAPGGEKLYQSAIQPVVDDLVESLNKSAENAASEAAPIFKQAITQMSIQEAWQILRGEYKNSGNTSATAYFKDKTYPDLVSLFQPKINTSLDKPLVNNYSANRIWNNFVRAYDAIVKSPANFVMKLDPVQEPDLSKYVTMKALDGLFAKVSNEEVEIRKDPYKYANRILEKVFGHPNY